MAKGHAFKATIKARFARDLSGLRKNAIAGYENHERVRINVGIYRYKDWQEVLKLKDPTCLEKMKLAFVTGWPSVPVDGTEIEYLATSTERNWI